MVVALFVVFLIVPVIELALIIEVGQVIGAWNTIAALLIVSFAGAWLVKREGMGVARRFREQMALGAVPGRELADGLLILFAGALLLTPGFVTDLLALLLLLPPVRAVIRVAIMRQVAVRAQRRRYQ